MVARKYRLYFKNILFPLGAFFLVFNLIFGFNSALASDDYSRCTYSSGDYSGDELCDGTSKPAGKEKVAGTGEDVKQIILLALCLGLGSLGFGLAFYILSKKQKNKTKD